MDIQLVSRDTELCRLCREFVAEFPGRFANVRDSGESIPEEHLHRIFEEYTSFADGHNPSHRLGIPPAVSGNGTTLQLVEIGAH